MKGYNISCNGIAKFTGKNVQSAYRYYTGILKKFQPDERPKTIESMYIAVKGSGLWMHNVIIEKSITFRIDLFIVETDFQALNIETNED